MKWYLSLIHIMKPKAFSKAEGYFVDMDQGIPVRYPDDLLALLNAVTKG